MSIWSSEQGDDVMAVNLHDHSTDEYRATGAERIIVDVATAVGWNDRIRLSLFEASGEHMDVCLALDKANARLLMDHLANALNRLEG